MDEKNGRADHNIRITAEQERLLAAAIKAGLTKELYKNGRITKEQFSRLMKPQSKTGGKTGSYQKDRAK